MPSSPRDRACSARRIRLRPGPPTAQPDAPGRRDGPRHCGSLAADAVLVVIGTAVFPSTSGYVHFRFGDYAKLTVIGVLIACAAWPVVCRIAAEPTWLFSRLAVLVTLVLLLPDAWLLHQHQSARAVAVLVLMHLAIALVTYFALVVVAPARRGASSRHTRESSQPDPLR